MSGGHRALQISTTHKVLVSAEVPGVQYGGSPSVPPELADLGMEGETHGKRRQRYS
ncbi:hypothetical protein PAAG_11335 [Paracoccidioides lutzii Pb01]|uniref:Uncharacterized protein n=1 Tax=Paracoccidioides lutzii (strain ATCC MYA-826 / Pb01) TaxID=502779 RepID=A0A0A2VM46_PARBA|nr:hypothetical protein PAAG_11335 [Paracoccidioides lutzii Pb01]KGQ01944.1 hypothetical protein PAAG_11335 [Paracoccidioides lutzii Pb01]